MNVLNRGLALVLLSFPLWIAAAELPSRRFNLPLDPGAPALQTPALNAAKALAEDAANSDKGAPLRYAIMHKAAVNVHSVDKAAVGRWTEVDANTMLWRARIDAPGAVSIDLALKPFHLPQGAEVWLTDAQQRVRRGPYTAADNVKSREFWTPYVPGDVAFLEVLVPKSRRAELALQIHSVQQAYRYIESGASPFAKSGSCNIDTICPTANNFRDQIQAVGRYTINGGLCSGQLINNTAQDRRRFFISASHCFNLNTGVGTQADANTIVVYWKYESPTCRFGTIDNVMPTPISVSIAQTGGATLRMTNRDSDTTLVELNSEIPNGVDPFWFGWDRSNNVSPNGVVIHHPQGHEKRISIENDPLVESNVQLNGNGVLGFHHWRVNDWDVGTTEQGSSGSGLMNEQKRLIGVLSGGSALCNNDLEDYFGRLNTAWEGGGPGSGTVREWLDPGNSGVTVLDGRGACIQPVVTVTVDTLLPIADNPVVITANISGGTGPYTLSWDVDGDNVQDRRVTGVGSSHQMSPRYPARTDTTVIVSATDATGCAASGSVALSVRGPRLAASPNGSPTQACGDGDANLEPGEIWNVPVRVSNSGEDTMNDGFALFTGGSATGVPGGDSGAVSDAFGYKGISSTTAPSQCRFQAIDMSAATPLTITKGPHTNNPSTSPLDEGFVAGLAVGGSQPFRFYDRDISTLLISTNGYLSTNSADGGDDYQAECGVDDHHVVDGRLQIFHEDMQLHATGSLKHRHFATCPRPSDVGSATQGCTVFEWNDTGTYQGSSPPGGHYVFQAVLYDLSYEIVYQYVTSDDATSGQYAVIGLQSPDETVRFNYACTVAASSPPGTSHCFFHPSAEPQGLEEASVHIVSQAANLGNLAVGSSIDVSAQAYIDPAATCGSRASVSYLGGVDDFTYSFAPSKVLDVAMPTSGNCQVATQCAAQITNIGAPTAANGMYANPTRTGNGLSLFNIGNVMSAAWFTGKADRTPVWYLMAGPWNPAFTQATAEVRQFTRTSVTPFAATSTKIGSTQLTRGDDDAVYLHSYEIDGEWGADKLIRAFASNDIPTPNHTGGWYNPAESGWGIMVDEHVLLGNPDTWFINYLYDAANVPRWTIGAAANTGGFIEQHIFLVHCPFCPKFNDFAQFPIDAGGQTRTYTSQTQATLNSTITLPAPLSGTWNRSNLPIQMITPPLSPTP